MTSTAGLYAETTKNGELHLAAALRFLLLGIFCFIIVQAGFAAAAGAPRR
jgi:hypothetical protein